MLRHSLSLLGIFALCSATFADSITYSYTLTNADPTFNRPLTGNPPTQLSGVGINNHYHLQPFYVNVSDSYTMQTTAANLTPGTSDDTFVILYQSAFAAGTPLVNALQADDDSGAGFLSLITRNLTPGVQYYFVTTTYDADVTGDFTVQIDSTNAGSTPILGLIAVPEPTTIALMGIAGTGVVGMGWSRWRAKRLVKARKYAHKSK